MTQKIIKILSSNQSHFCLGGCDFYDRMRLSISVVFNLFHAATHFVTLLT